MALLKACASSIRLSAPPPPPLPADRLFSDLGGTQEGCRDRALQEVTLGLALVNLRRDSGVGVGPLQSVLVHREL